MGRARGRKVSADRDRDEERPELDGDDAPKPGETNGDGNKNESVGSPEPDAEADADSNANAAPETPPASRGPPKKRQTKARNPTPDPRDDDDDQEYEVEEILDSKKVKGKVHFLIRWKGYQSESDTWEPESTLSCPELIAKFKNKQANGKSKSKRGIKRKGRPKKEDVKKSKIAKRTKKTQDSDLDDDDGEDGKEYEVEKILEVHHKKNGTRDFLIHWKGWASKHDSWEPEDNLNCVELIKNFMKKVDAKREVTPRELRADPKSTKRFTLTSKDSGRRLSKRSDNRQRVRYDNTD